MMSRQITYGAFSDPCLKELSFVDLTAEQVEEMQKSESNITVGSLFTKADTLYLKNTTLASVAVEMPGIGYVHVAGGLGLESTMVPQGTSLVRSPTTDMVTGLSPVTGG